MNVPIEFLAIFLTAVLAALGGLFTYVMNEIKGVGKTLTGILDHLAKLNGRQGKSEPGRRCTRARTMSGMKDWSVSRRDSGRPLIEGGYHHER